MVGLRFKVPNTDTDDVGCMVRDFLYSLLNGFGGSCLHVTDRKDKTRTLLLVWDNVLGTWSGHKAELVRRFAVVQSEAKRGVTGYAAAV